MTERNGENTLRLSDRFKERLQIIISEEINLTNMIADAPPEIWIPHFKENLSNRLRDICKEELTYKVKEYAWRIRRLYKKVGRKR